MSFTYQQRGWRDFMNQRWNCKLTNWWSRVLSQKLTAPQLVNKLLSFYETRKFIATSASACHLSLSWATINPIHASPSDFVKVHLNIILSSIPRSSKWSLCVTYTNQNPVFTSPVLHTCHMFRSPHSSWFDHLSNTWRGLQIMP